MMHPQCWSVVAAHGALLVQEHSDCHASKADELEAKGLGSEYWAAWAKHLMAIGISVGFQSLLSDIASVSCDCFLFRLF